MSVVDPLKAYDEIARWERAWIETVALAWKDDGFRKSILENGGANAKVIIFDKFKVELPGDVKLRIVAADADHPKWDTDKKHPRAVTVLTLVLPTAPKNIEDHAIALSQYVASGHSMPFTCCC